MAEFNLLDALSGLSKTDLGELLPEGMYPMVVDSCEYQVSKNKGTPGWTYKATITDGEFEGEHLEGTAWYSKTTRGMQLYWQQMQALGVTLPWVQATNPGPEDIAKSIVGARFMGDVGIEEPQAGSRQRRRNRLIASTAIADDAGDNGYPEAEVDASGEVLVDDIFTEGPAVDVPGQEPEPEGPSGDLDDPTLPSPDGTAGDAAVPLTDEAAPEVAAAAGDPDDPWG